MSSEADLKTQLESVCRSLENTIAIADIYLNALIELQKKYPDDPDILEALDKAGDLAEKQLKQEVEDSNGTGYH